MARKRKPNIPDKAPEIDVDIELDGQTLVQNQLGHRELAKVDKDGKTHRTFNEKLSKILEAGNRRDFLKKTGATLAASTGGFGKAVSAVSSAAGSAAGSAASAAGSAAGSAALPSVLAKALGVYENSGYDQETMAQFMFDLSELTYGRPYLINNTTSYSYYNHKYDSNNGLSIDDVHDLVSNGYFKRENEIVVGARTEMILNSLNDGNCVSVCGELFCFKDSHQYNEKCPELIQWGIQAAIDKFGIEEFKNSMHKLSTEYDGYTAKIWWSALKYSKTLQNHFGLTPSQYKNMILKGQYKQLNKCGIMTDNEFEMLSRYNQNGYNDFNDNSGLDEVDEEISKKIDKAKDESREQLKQHDKKFKPRSDEYKFSMHGPVDWDPDEPEHAWESVNKPHYSGWL